MTLKSAADSLLAIIEDLLDLSRVEAGRMELTPAAFSLRQMLGETLKALAQRAYRKGLEVACDFRGDVPDALVGDVGRLRQVLINLVGNAIKFTASRRGHRSRSPSPTPAGNAGAKADGEVCLSFTVRDTGIGIAPETSKRRSSRRSSRGTPPPPRASAGRGSA